MWFWLLPFRNHWTQPFSCCSFRLQPSVSFPSWWTGCPARPTLKFNLESTNTNERERDIYIYIYSKICNQIIMNHKQIGLKENAVNNYYIKCSKTHSIPMYFNMAHPAVLRSALDSSASGLPWALVRPVVSSAPGATADHTIQIFHTEKVSEKSGKVPDTEHFHHWWGSWPWHGKAPAGHPSTIFRFKTEHLPRSPTCLETRTCSCLHPRPPGPGAP